MDIFGMITFSVLLLGSEEAEPEPSPESEAGDSSRGPVTGV